MEILAARAEFWRSEEHTSELQSRQYLVCRLLLEKKKHTSELQSRQYLVCRLLLEKKKILKEAGASVDSVDDDITTEVDTRMPAISGFVEIPDDVRTSCLAISRTVPCYCSV